jgi:hypothetical protein
MTSQHETGSALVHIVASVREHHAARYAMAYLEERGIGAVHDWIAGVDSVLAAGRSAAALTLGERIALYRRSLAAIDSVRVVWFLAPSPELDDPECWCEFQAAIERRKYTVASGSRAWDSVPADMADRIFRDHFSAVDHIANRLAQIGFGPVEAAQ